MMNRSNNTLGVQFYQKTTVAMIFFCTLITVTINAQDLASLQDQINQIMGRQDALETENQDLKQKIWDRERGDYEHFVNLVYTAVQEGDVFEKTYKDLGDLISRDSLFVRFSEVIVLLAMYWVFVLRISLRTLRVKCLQGGWLMLLKNDGMVLSII